MLKSPDIINGQLDMTTDSRQSINSLMKTLTDTGCLYTIIT